MGLPCLHIIQKHLVTKKPLTTGLIDWHWKYHKFRPTRNATAAPVWDILPRQLLGSADFDDGEVSDSSQPLTPTQEKRQPTPTTPEFSPAFSLHRTPTPISVSDEIDENDPHANVEPHLLVLNPDKIKPKGRPPGASNKKRTKRQAQFEDSTQRDPSRFEYQEEHIQRSQRGAREGG